MKAAQTSYAKGVLAEERAAMQLRLAGYKILETRYKTQYGEIDIVALKGDVLAFVEVKAHKSAEASLYAVTPKTRRRIENAALWFLSEHPDYTSHGMRFDVMVFKAGGIWAEHLDNAWMVGS